MLKKITLLILASSLAFSTLPKEDKKSVPTEVKTKLCKQSKQVLLDAYHKKNPNLKTLKKVTKQWNNQCSSILTFTFPTPAECNEIKKGLAYFKAHLSSAEDIKEWNQKRAKWNTKCTDLMRFKLDAILTKKKK